jgi:S-adenosylmethionine decarboxylase
MRMYIGLAIFEGVSRAALDDEAGMRAALERGVAAGKFTLYDLRAVRFTPQGVTAAAIVGESHLTLHSWPEEGRLFVDVASCSTEASVRQAIDAIGAALDGARLAEIKVSTMGG